MNTNVNLMVFTDLDGTLIDHDTYRWDTAQQALTALRETSSGVILASSKTAAEIGTLRAGLGLNQWPAIVENGAGLLPPNDKLALDNSQYLRLRSVLDSIPKELRRLFCGFGDVSAGKVVQMTGLTHAAAELAKQRDFSEPGEWLGTEKEKEQFLAHLKALGVAAQQGGRFLTLSFGRNKADQMNHIIETYKPRQTIALGDAPNDIAMLEAADIGVVIANPHRAPLPLLSGETEGRILRTRDAGPVGWNQAILELLERFELYKD